jgi:16S rRNA G966 N2-methylase RsmD
VSRQAVRLIQENIRLLGRPAAVQVIHEDARRFLHRYAGSAFDLVFMDPPYYHGFVEVLLPELRGKVSRGGVIVAETGKEERLVPEPFVIRIVKEYGDSKVWFLQNS